MGAAASGLSGAANGFAGLLGLGGFWNPIDEDELKKVQEGLKNAQTFWEDKIRQCKENLGEERIAQLNVQQQLIVKQQDVINESLSERIQTNTLLIVMLVFLVFFLIGYTLF